MSISERVVHSCTMHYHALSLKLVYRRNHSRRWSLLLLLLLLFYDVDDAAVDDDDGFWVFLDLLAFPPSFLPSFLPLCHPLSSLRIDQPYKTKLLMLMYRSSSLRGGAKCFDFWYCLLDSLSVQIKIAWQSLWPKKNFSRVVFSSFLLLSLTRQQRFCFLCKIIMWYTTKLYTTENRLKIVIYPRSKSLNTCKIHTR